MKYLSSMVVLLGAFVCPVRAGFLNWTYTTTPNVPGIAVNGSPSSGGAAVTLTNEARAGATSIPVLAYVTQASSTTPISFNNSTFNLGLKITDSNNASGTLNFTGSLNGALTANTSSVVASFAPLTARSLILDGHTYTVSIPSLTLAAPTSPQQNIMASVSVANASTGVGTPSPHVLLPHPSPQVLLPQPSPQVVPLPPSHGTPEPTSLLLGSLGFSCFGAGCWWKRRRLT